MSPELPNAFYPVYSGIAFASSGEVVATRHLADGRTLVSRLDGERRADELLDEQLRLLVMN